MIKLIVENTKVKFYNNYKEADKAYKKYLKDHIENVKRSWNEVLRPYLEEPGNLIEFDDATVEELDHIQIQINNHDKSKYSAEEYEPYRNSFYPTCQKDLSELNKNKYDLAWLHHIHVNSHHPQHWILETDSEGLKVLDMDFSSICEMLCDWHSFSALYPTSTCDKWYNQNKNKIKLSFNTKQLVEKLLVAFKGNSLFVSGG